VKGWIKMTIKIIDKNWDQTFSNLAKLAKKRAIIISPFLGDKTLRNILGLQPQEVKVITRFNLNELLINVSEIKALEYLLEIGAQVKGVKHLHSKVYIFGTSKAIITSANMTEAGLNRNTECGVESDEPKFISSVEDYFNSLWDRAGSILNISMLNKWKKEIAKAELTSKGKAGPNLGDFGTNLGFDEKNDTSDAKTYSSVFPGQYFIKFFGISSDRSSRDTKIFKEIESSESHKVLSYPKNKRPRQVNDGDLIFISRLVENPNDIMIYGRCRSKKYVEKRDDATKQDIALRDWHKKWPHYIRVEQTEFINATLNDCISFNDIMQELGTNTFITTQANALSGKGNKNPRKAYMQQAAARLTLQATQVLNHLFDEKLIKFGRIRDEELVKIK
jgi:hypothetical protein